MRFSSSIFVRTSRSKLKESRTSVVSRVGLPWAANERLSYSFATARARARRSSPGRSKYAAIRDETLNLSSEVDGEKKASSAAQIDTIVSAERCTYWPMVNASTARANSAFSFVNFSAVGHRSETQRALTASGRPPSTASEKRLISTSSGITHAFASDDWASALNG